MINIEKSKIIILIAFIILLINAGILEYKYKVFYGKVQSNIEIEAIVISNKVKKEYYNSYSIKGINGIFKSKKFILYSNKEMDFGDKIKIRGIFYEPNEVRNYKGFNYKRYLQTQKIYGTIKADNVKVISKDNINIILTGINNIRLKIITKIQNALPKETGGLLIGLLIGEKQYIEEDIIEGFQKSSLAHILAISGTHATYIVLGLTYILTISKIHKKYGYIIVIIFLIFFLFLTNFSFSVIRACIMSIILIISKITYRKPNIKNMLIISLFISLIFNPYAIYSASLQLSYLGTIGVIYFSPIICEILVKYKINKKISNIISIPIAAQILILPIMIINFNTISFTFIISNVIAIPLLGISIIGGFLFLIISIFFPWFASKISILLDIILKVLIYIAKVTSKLKASTIYVVTPSVLTVCLYYLLILIVIYRFKRKREFLKLNLKNLILILLLLILIIEFPYYHYNGKLKIYFIDVGQRR